MSVVHYSSFKMGPTETKWKALMTTQKTPNSSKSTSRECNQCSGIKSTTGKNNIQVTLQSCQYFSSVSNTILHTFWHHLFNTITTCTPNTHQILFRLYCSIGSRYWSAPFYITLIWISLSLTFDSFITFPPIDFFVPHHESQDSDLYPRIPCIFIYHFDSPELSYVVSTSFPFWISLIFDPDLPVSLCI